MVDEALPGFRLLRGGRLRLPMKQRRRNRIVLVERGRRVFAFGLLECHEEQVRIRRLVSNRTGLLPRGLVKIQDPERGEHVVDRVARMHRERHSDGRSGGVSKVEWIGEMVRRLVQYGEQFAQFLDDGWMRMK